MVEKILLLNKLSRVEIIKLLNISDLSLEQLLDFRIIIKEELKKKHKSIKKIEFKEEFNNFYNLDFSSEYDELDKFNLVDLVELIKIKDMDFCELLYLDVIIEDSLDKLLSLDGGLEIDDNNSTFSLYDHGVCNFGKICFIASGSLMYGYDEKYNFYVGKIDKDRKCVLFNVMRKGLPYDLCRDILVFNGVVSDNNKLNGFWSAGLGEVNVGINKANNMNDGYYFNLGDSEFDIKNLDVSYVACSEGTNSLDELLKGIKNKSKKLMRG